MTFILPTKGNIDKITHTPFDISPGVDVKSMNAYVEKKMLSTENVRMLTRVRKGNCRFAWRKRSRFFIHVPLMYFLNASCANICIILVERRRDYTDSSNAQQNSSKTYDWHTVTEPTTIFIVYLRSHPHLSCSLFFLTIYT